MCKKKKKTLKFTVCELNQTVLGIVFGVLNEVLEFFIMQQILIEKFVYYEPIKWYNSVKVKSTKINITISQETEICL